MTVILTNNTGSKTPSRSFINCTASILIAIALGIGLILWPFATSASELGTHPDYTDHWIGIICIIIFVLAYSLVISEETLHLRKSKPVMVAAGIIWALVAIAFVSNGDTSSAKEAVRHNLLEFAELFLFLLAAMTYINSMDERGVFDVIRSWLVGQGFSYRKIFWLTGGIAFVLSPIADNLTSALLMATIVVAIGGTKKHFIATACVHVVVAANAGGVFSPFGDITTLMVWQKGIVEFGEFFALFLPAVANWLIPAIIMSTVIPRGIPNKLDEDAQLQHGALVVVGLFVLTVAMAIASHNFLHLPPVIGMMTGLGLLKLYGYYLKRRDDFFPPPEENGLGESALELDQITPSDTTNYSFNIFKALERAEWDTLMFFYGIILCVGGLGSLGYLHLGSELLYGNLGPTHTNILVGVLSALIDNIPVMFAVLAVLPEMSHGQWLLVTLTAGVGGSLLSIGSAAGVAVMGQARGTYTFLSHLKWSWAIALGYAASIGIHFLVNKASF